MNSKKHTVIIMLKAVVSALNIYISSMKVDVFTSVTKCYYPPEFNLSRVTQ